MDKTLSLLGLALRAGQLYIGEEPVRTACHVKSCRLLILAQDAASSSVQKASRFAADGQCLCIAVPYTKAQLGQALGRDLCAMAAVSNTGLALAFTQKLAHSDPERYGPAAERLRVKAARAERRKEQGKCSRKTTRKRTAKKSNSAKNN